MSRTALVTSSSANASAAIIMCLILLAWKVDPRRDLVVAANRDEYYERPTEAAHFWSKDHHHHDDQQTILGARDLRSGGTALAVHTHNGRFAAVTNIRNAAAAAAAPKKTNSRNTAAPSRGLLVTQFLEADEDMTPGAFLQELTRTADQYEGFNLLVADCDSCWHYSNGADKKNPPQKLVPGAVYGLSNHHAIDPLFGWPKVAKGKAALQQYLDSTNRKNDTETQEHRDEHRERLFQAMSDPKVELEDANLPTETTGYSVEIERALSSMFVKIGTEYGTRSTTLVERCCRGDSDSTTTPAAAVTTVKKKMKMTTHYCERTYSSSGKAEQTLEYSFSSTVT